MAFSLRLPPALDREARIRADQIGIPLNGLICFALDLYLRGGGAAAASLGVVVDSLDFENPLRLSRGGMPLKVPQPLKEASKRPPAASKPAPVLQSLPVGDKLSKAQRREITAQARLARKS